MDLPEQSLLSRRDRSQTGNTFGRAAHYHNGPAATSLPISTRTSTTNFDVDDTQAVQVDGQVVGVEVEEEEDWKAVRAISKHGLVLGLILRGEAAACVLPAASDRRAVQNQETWFALFHSTPPNPLRRPDRQKTLLGGAATFFRGCYFLWGLLLFFRGIGQGLQHGW